MQNSVLLDEEIKISAIDYLKGLGLHPEKITDEIAHKWCQRMRYIWTKKSGLEILKDIIEGNL